jgi:hypothetical protein
MKYLLLLSLLILLLSCGEKPKDAPLSSIAEKSQQYLDVRFWHQEYINIDSILINGKIPGVTTLPELLRIMGKPNKILTKPIEASNLYYLAKNVHVNCYYYNNLIFEEYQGKVLIHTINLKNSMMEISCSKIRLNAQTIPKDVQKIFPESGKLISGTGNTWSGYLIINAFPPYAHGKIWLMTFNAGNLSKMILYDVPVHEL